MQGRFLFGFSTFFFDVKEQPEDSGQQPRTFHHNNLHKGIPPLFDTTVYAAEGKVVTRSAIQPVASVASAVSSVSSSSMGTVISSASARSSATPSPVIEEKTMVVIS